MAPRTTSKSKAATVSATPARLDEQWWIKSRKPDGTCKSKSDLDREKRHVQETIDRLEGTLDREMMHHEIKQVARLVEQGHTPSDIINCPGLLDLPEHHTKWGEMFGNSSSDADDDNNSRTSDTAGVSYSTLNLSSSSLHNSSRNNQGGRVAAYASALKNIPGVKDKHSHLQTITISRLPPAILQHMKEFFNANPANVHEWADREAVKDLPAKDKLNLDSNITIAAGLIEWYSDAFMSSLYSVLTHRDALHSVSLSRENVSACSYTTRAQIAAMLNLVPPSMWNEEMNEETTKAYTKNYRRSGSEYDQHTQEYMRCRRMAIAFSPNGSAQTDIVKWVIGQRNIIQPRIEGARAGVRKVVRVQVPNKKSADEFRRILGGDCQGVRSLCLSAWADASCIMVSAPMPSLNQYVYIDSSLLEFNSKAFLMAVVNNIHGRSTIHTRSDAIKFLIDAYKLPLQHEAHRPPTPGQLSAYKRYLSSPHCKYSDQDVCMLMASIAPEAENGAKRGLTCTVAIERLDAYPLDFLWLAARSLGAVASHSAGRAKLYGVNKDCVFEHEQKVAHAAFDDDCTAKYKPKLVDILKRRLSCASTTNQPDDALLLKLQISSDVNLAKAYLAALESKYNFVEQDNSADGDVLQGIMDTPPTLTIREPSLHQLSNSLVHLLLCVLLDSADDAKQHLPAEPFHPASCVYTRSFRSGFIRNLRQHKPPTTTAEGACCPRKKQ